MLLPAAVSFPGEWKASPFLLTLGSFLKKGPPNYPAVVDRQYEGRVTSHVQMHWAIETSKSLSPLYRQDLEVQLTYLSTQDFPVKELTEKLRLRSD